MRIKGINKNKLFFTADEHYWHRNVLKYENRPFQTIEDMNEALIQNFNELVPKDGTTIHAGDFCLGHLKTPEVYKSIINRLSGSHIFIMGSHDRWLNGVPNIHEIVEILIDKRFLVISHYCIRSWARSHYNSWHLFGHSHGRLIPIGKSWDIGVDNNNFYPLSFTQIETIMNNKPDNPNFIPFDKRKR